MIVINEKKYNNVTYKVSFGKYSATQDGKKRNGEAPFISFKFNNILLGLETIYDKEWLKELKQNDKKDISKYISDITYEDEKGWISLITEQHKCYINRIEKNIFNIELECDAEDFEEIIISLNEKIEIDFK